MAAPNWTRSAKAWNWGTVKSASAVNGPIQAGMRLAVGGAGQARALKTVVVEGVTLAESSPTVGIALGAPSEDGLVWVLVNLDPIPIHADSPSREDKRTQCGP